MAIGQGLKIARFRVDSISLYLALPIAATIACVGFQHQQTITGFFDAKAHLHIARQVVDGLTPGFAQLGGVWLPLPHLLMLPFVWVDGLFTSGLAGSIVSMAAFVGASLFFLRLAKLLLGENKASYVALLVFVLNPNLLYLQATPTTESLYLLTFVASCYFLIRWLLNERHRDLVWTAFWVFLATLTRYDGWALFLFITGVIVVVGIRRSRVAGHGVRGLGVQESRGSRVQQNPPFLNSSTPEPLNSFPPEPPNPSTLNPSTGHQLEANLFTFLPLAGLGIFLWLVWNAVIFGNPLYFMLGEYSGHHSQAMLFEEGYLPTKGNLFLCVAEYLYVTLANHGVVVYALFVLGVLLTLSRWRSRRKGGQEVRRVAGEESMGSGVNESMTSLPPHPLTSSTHNPQPLSALRIRHSAFLLLSPLAFHILSLYLGHSAMLVPKLSGIPMKAIFNARFGIVMLPAVALFVGSLARGRRWRSVLVAGLIVAQYGWMFGAGDIVTLKDARDGWGNGDARPVEQWLRYNYEDGFVLTDASANVCRFIDTRIPMNRFITQASQPYWQQALENPSEHADWVWFTKYPQDRVWQVVENRPEFAQQYRQVFREKETYVYRRREK